jgi:hypothetical protein
LTGREGEGVAEEGMAVALDVFCLRVGEWSLEGLFDWAMMHKRRGR